VFVCDAEGEGFGGDWGEGNGVIFDVLIRFFLNKSRQGSCCLDSVHQPCFFSSCSSAFPGYKVSVQQH
jgi:hypothetical protein